jgi:hypothetical protein
MSPPRCPCSRRARAPRNERRAARRNGTCSRLRPGRSRLSSQLAKPGSRRRTDGRQRFGLDVRAGAFGWRRVSLLDEVSDRGRRKPEAERDLARCEVRPGGVRQVTHVERPAKRLTGRQVSVRERARRAGRPLRSALAGRASCPGRSDCPLRPGRTLWPGRARRSDRPARSPAAAWSSRPAQRSSCTRRSLRGVNGCGRGVNGRGRLADFAHQRPCRGAAQRRRPEHGDNERGRRKYDRQAIHGGAPPVAVLPPIRARACLGLEAPRRTMATGRP